MTLAIIITITIYFHLLKIFALQVFQKKTKCLKNNMKVTRKNHKG